LDAFGEGLNRGESALAPAVLLEQPLDLVEAELECVPGEMDERLRLACALLALRS
jgi:hypothetical protein